MADAGRKLSLAERRLVEGYRQEVLPGLLAEIVAAAGFDLPVEVDWDAVVVPGQTDWMRDTDSYWTAVFFRPLIQALAMVGRDAMGKEAIREGLRKVVLTYDEATAPAGNYPNGLGFADGVLTINFVPGVNAHDEAARAEAIVALLESRL